MRTARVPALVAVFAGMLMAVATAPAHAAFHFIKVREVYAGGAANTSYVELQMYAPGQELVAGHSVTLYDSSGALVHTSTFSTSVPSGANQATVLVGDTEVESAFSVAPDRVDAGLGISPAGGAACWNAGGVPADCVSWGAFTGGAALQTATGTTAGSPVSPGGITAAKAIRRKISPGCPTMLEDTDDTHDSATDFEEVSPAPRANASPIVETACVGPTATIDTKPANPTSVTAATFTYHSTPAGATFECRLDAAAFAGCEASGRTYPGPLADGSHTFQVRAQNESGTGPAASYTWTVDTAPPLVSVTGHPADPSPGNSAAFTYASDEAGSTFECSLHPAGVPASFTACPLGGKTYPDAEHPAPLADGEWVFEVRATDKAGNRSTPEAFPAGTFTWQVDNSLADTTPPQTTITSAPPNPSDSSVATFAYASNEAGSTFECKLDDAAFSSCPALGITYIGLANGSHTFQVRAADPSGNVDPTAAGHSFDIVAFSLPAPPTPVPPVPASRPDTRLLGAPRGRTTDRTPTIRFATNAAAARFQCAVDSAPFRFCRSPFTPKPLPPGPHRIRVRAHAAGLIDPTPAIVRFTIARSGGRR